MQSHRTLLILALLWQLQLLRCRQSVLGVYGEEAAQPGAEDEDDDLNDHERAQIEGAVQSLANQFTEEVKGALTEQFRAQKLGGSKVSQSRIAKVSELLMAAANNQYERVERLLANGADPNADTPSRTTALHSAAEQGYKDIVDLLLAFNATVDARGPNEATPLHLAAHKGRNSVTELLLRHDADVNAETANPPRFTPLYLASEMGHATIVAKLLAANASTFSRAHDGSTALHVAAGEGHASVVQALLDAGASADEPDNDGARPVHWATSAGHEDIVRLLLEAGAVPISEEEEDVHVGGRARVKVEMRTITMAA